MIRFSKYVYAKSDIESETESAVNCTGKIQLEVEQ